MEQLLRKNPRIEVVDALRGFAVMAIILVHNLEHFIFPVYPTDSPTWLNVLDQACSMRYSACSPEKHTPFLPCYLALPFISKAITRSGKAKISGIVSCGGWFCWQVLRR